MSWRLIKKKDPVPVTQQSKTFTQLGPLNPEATLPYSKDLHSDKESEKWVCGGAGASAECRRTKDGAKDNDLRLSNLHEKSQKGTNKACMHKQTSVKCRAL